MESLLSWPLLWEGLFWPLIRLTFFISVGLFVGNLIESLNWTRHVARIAEPLARRARLKDVSAAAFSLAFFSGVTANTMLAEAHEKETISDRELLLSNLFNSLPTYFLHLPTIFFIAAPFIGSAAFIYVGITAGAALLRTAAIVCMGRFMLPPVPDGCVPCRLDEAPDLKGSALQKTWRRFKKRLPRILKFTVPIYILFFLLRHYGFFDAMQETMATKVSFFTWLPPEALGIVAFHVAGEFTVGLAAAGALIQEAALDVHVVVLALLTGNVLSSPMRAFRHQFPYYAGIFKPRMAARLIVVNQSLRALSITLVAICYAFLG
ncbi:hypothetical protein [Salidesulfovibrio brasiliensis]|uniref:hypothetical protein n=1 Tax=Salidesulfovibrio brasiliensis TaxID=221711 RepID=UPI0006D291DC|nr:hypothetical protein [Salidesulfovibrio brasiliensis]